MFDEVRNFIILHYKATLRDDSEFWNYCREMSVPDELDYRMKLFRERGIASHRPNELFIETNWLAVYLGQGLIPESYDPRAGCLDEATIRGRMRMMREYLQNAATALPSHAEALAEHCAMAEPA
jgi:tryptophan halogenase